MEKITKLSKFILFISILSFIVWFGSFLVKMLSIYGMFLPDKLELKTTFTEVDPTSLFYFMLPTFVTNISSFGIFILTFILFLITGKINLKNEGWLFISTILILITAPLEIFLYTIDWKIIFEIMNGIQDKNLIFGLIVKRVSVFGSFPVIEFFLYVGVIFLFIFRPMRKLHNED